MTEWPDCELELRYEAARHAGGLTTSELRRLKMSHQGRWLDPDTDMWIPNGVFLFRRRRPGVIQDNKARDILEV